MIRDNGFSPKGAEVTLKGQLVRSNGLAWLESPGLPRYRLTAANDAARASLQARPSGATIEVRGEIAAAKGTASELTVTQVVGQ